MRNRIGNEHKVHFRNTAEIVLGTNIGLVITDLHWTYCRNRIGNKHRFATMIHIQNTGEIALASNMGFVTTDLRTNVGFVTTALHSKY